MNEEHDEGRRPVVVGVDGSPDSDLALRWACDEGRRRGVEVVALTVVPVYPAMAAPDGPAAVTEAEAILRASLERVASGGLPVRAALVCAPPAPGLRSEAERLDAALVVVGRRGAGRFSRMLVGSVSTALAHKPGRPLVIVPGPEPLPPTGARQRILVGVDGSPAAAAALVWATHEAEVSGATLDVLYASTEPVWGVTDRQPLVDDGALGRPTLPELHQTLDALPASWRHEVDVRVATGDAGTLLLRNSTAYDLVVVGAPRPGSLRRRVFGSVSQSLARHCPVPVAIIPAGVTAREPGDLRLAAVG
ncbi:universal stress protein [Acidiferrimicrobium sp. IK]|uniref:universal stress protein n=1 Tax=Acidiferrimicrobium sp. IK TaxID=2871700 RepID=UPI0021CB4FC2|nr:universal stress protein [Acidiferrimicrobium sp. IK]MCU4182852.1 universal stress protein [Acidiferrimicrobium sp. IK]